MRTAQAGPHAPVRPLDLWDEGPALAIGADGGDELERLTPRRATWLDG